MTKVEIDGTTYEVEDGKTMLDVAIENNIDIPTLCHHKVLGSYGSCRLCVIEILKDGWSKLTTACTLPATEGLKILTSSEKVNQSRKMTVELLLSRCPEEKVLLDLAEEYDLKEPRFKKKDDNCIFCGLCVRMCERMGVNAINFTGRGIDRELGTPYMVPSNVCMTCGACAFICPTSRFTQKKTERISGNKPIPIPSEFNEGMEPRQAIYIPFPQAVPKVPVIDKERCVYYLTGECKTCENFCEAGAIQYDQEDEIIEIDVGTIVVATGYDLYDPSEKPEYGYEKYDNVITGLEFERLVSASGPTEGHIEINGKEPKKVVFIQCVGSRDKEGHEYCSRVCCMYTAKQAHMVKDKIPNSELVVYYTDVRAFGKGFEEFYNRVQGEGIIYRRRELDDPIEVTKKGDNVVVKAKGHPDIDADLVVLATAIIPRTDSKEFSRVLNVNQSADGFYLEAHPKLRPLDTFTDGIFLAGCCQSPKDIPDAVAQASGAAVRASEPLAQGKVVVEAISSVIDEDLCSGCRTCEQMCAYSALEFDNENKVMKVTDVMCKGCGSCASACPSGAISMRHFNLRQLLAQVEGMI